MYFSVFPIIIGFFICILLRLIYKKIPYQEISLLSLLFAVFVSSVSGAVFITIVSNFIYNNILQSYGTFSVGFYISDIFEMTIPLFGWSMLYFSIKYLQEWKKQKEKGEIADMLVQNAEFQILRYRLNPDFLFESLNCIRNIIRKDKKLGKQLITHLSEFLRYSLLCRNKEEIPFKDELEAIKNFLVIENYRSGDNIIFYFDVSPEAGDFPVLCFTIHQLVERLIEYSDSEDKKPKRLNIKSNKINDKLQVEIILTENSDSLTTAKNIEKELKKITEKMGSIYTDRHTLNLIEDKNSLSVKLEIRE